MSKAIMAQNHTPVKPSFTPLSTGILQRKCGCGKSSGLSGECSECQKKKLTLQRQAKNQEDVTEVPPIVHEVLRSPGQPLDSDTRTFMESRFGHDFSQVRIHTDAKAAESAEAVNAQAYTVGRDIVFRNEQYAPQTKIGQNLIAHELTHVLQQGNNSSALSSKLTVGGSDHISELEADRTANKIMQSERTNSIQLHNVERHILQRDQPNTSRPTFTAQTCEDDFQNCIKTSSNSLGCIGQRSSCLRQFSPAEVLETPKENQPVGEKEQQPVKQAAKISTGIFRDSVATKALVSWDYVVHSDHVRLGNRVIDKERQQVIGSWPWMTNNPGDLTVDVQPPKNRTQETRAFGLGAYKNIAARTDLAIFPDMSTGETALKTWLRKYYAGQTIASAASSHLGPKKTHMKGVDDPEKYAKQVQAFINKRNKVKLNVYTTRITADMSEEIINEIALAFGNVEGVENIGVIYTCNGRDSNNDQKMESWKREHKFVKNLPQSTPPEIKALLGCP